MGLVYIWYNNRYRSEVSISNILLWPIGHKGKKKARSQGQILENHMYTSKGTVLMQSS